MAPARIIPEPAPSYLPTDGTTPPYESRAEQNFPFVSAVLVAVVTVIVVTEIEQLE